MQYKRKNNATYRRDCSRELACQYVGGMTLVSFPTANTRVMARESVTNTTNDAINNAIINNKE